MMWTFLIFLLPIHAGAEPEYDLSVFENNSDYTVEFDDMDDTGTITFAADSEKSAFIFEIIPRDGGGSDLIMGDIDIRIVENFPPLMRLSLYYYGEDWIFTDEIILKPAETRYTFEIERESEVMDGGTILEGGVVLITDVSIGLIEDIVNGNISSVRCRFSGDRDVDVDLTIDVESLKQLYEDYIASGSLENDFSLVNQLCPCTVK